MAAKGRLAMISKVDRQGDLLIEDWDEFMQVYITY